MKIEWTTLIAATLALLGSSSVINLLYQEFFKPNINSEMILDPNFQSARIEVKNTGSKLASNLSTIVIAPENITSVKNLFSPPGLKITDSGRFLNIGDTDKGINNNVLQFSIPNLIHGDASEIVLDISFLDKAHSTSDYDISDYNISSFYDQGSISGTIKKNEPLLNNITNTKDIYYYINNITESISAASGIAGIGGAILSYFLPKLLSYLRLRNERKNLLENIMSLRYSIQFEPEELTDRKISQWLSKTTKEKLALFHIDKCILIDDFYGILNVYLNNQNQLSEEEKKRLRNACIELSNKIFIREEKTKQKITAK